MHDNTLTIPAVDPYPVGSVVTVVDYDGKARLGPFEVVRSYHPSAVVELATHDGMVRQNHDRMRPFVDSYGTGRWRTFGCSDIEERMLDEGRALLGTRFARYSSPVCEVIGVDASCRPSILVGAVIYWTPLETNRWYRIGQVHTCWAKDAGWRP